VLVFVAAGVSLFFWLQGVLNPAAAAALVAVAYLLVAIGTWWVGWRWMKGAGALTLPQTRAMLWEAITCRDEATTSSERSARADRM